MSKTAMQEAIELVKKYDSREIPFNVMLFNLELLLKKEKEQIIGDYFNGKKSGVEIWKNGLPDITAEEYYNQTYNNGEN